MVLSRPIIKEIITAAGIKKSAQIIRDSFGTVALEFGLTRKNCPTHPSLITNRQLSDLHEVGLKYFGIFRNNEQVGFVAIETDSDGNFHFNNLAVCPAFRHYGYGRDLVAFALDYSRAHKGKKVSIGIIDEHKILKRWYQQLGFKEIGINNFVHLPFTVCFMEKELSSQEPGLPEN